MHWVGLLPGAGAVRHVRYGSHALARAPRGVLPARPRLWRCRGQLALADSAQLESPFSGVPIAIGELVVQDGTWGEIMLVLQV